MPNTDKVSDKTHKILKAEKRRIMNETLENLKELRDVLIKKKQVA